MFLKSDTLIIRVLQRIIEIRKGQQFLQLLLLTLYRKTDYSTLRKN